MTELEWREPPPSRRGKHSAGKGAATAAALRQRPGVWARISQDGNSGTAIAIKSGKASAFSPGGSFEAVTRKRPDGNFDIYARYVGENGEHA
jgi:hypothetical protein